jgi:hypothetical protein
MNYKYKIEEKSLGFMVVKETHEHGIPCSFSLMQLKRNKKYSIDDFVNYQHLESYRRTKKWLLQNYPELML